MSGKRSRSLKLDRKFAGVGRIVRASGTSKRKVHREINDLLTRLYEDGKLEILKAIKDGRVSPLEAYSAFRAKKLTHLPASIELSRPLWDSVAEWVPRSAKAESTRKRYETSFKALRRAGVLKEGAEVSDLRDVDWIGLRDRWPNSGSDWNRLRAAVSRFLTMILEEDKLHPFRRDVMKRLKRDQEVPARVPDLTPAELWRLVDTAAEPIRGAIVFLATTGLRVGEYLALEEHHLLPLTRQVKVPGTKTAGSAALIYVDEELWPWVLAAVPSPFRYKALRLHFKEAAERIGKPDLRLHDLRHLHGQMLADANVPESKIQASLRHVTPAMTRRYTKQRDRGDAARVVGDVLLNRKQGA